ncbi:hypothetical protein THAOC_28240, partial [Thalassiosira oceanica]
SRTKGRLEADLQVVERERSSPRTPSRTPRLRRRGQVGLRRGRLQAWSMTELHHNEDATINLARYPPALVFAPPFRADGPPSIAILENSPAWSTRDVRLIPRAESSRDVSESRRLWVDLGPVCRICTKSSFPESSRRALQVTLNRRIQGRASGGAAPLVPRTRSAAGRPHRPVSPGVNPGPGGLGGERMTLHVDSTASRPSLIVLPPADCAIVV